MEIRLAGVVDGGSDMRLDESGFEEMIVACEEWYKQSIFKRRELTCQ